jgi:hypothetical protein
VGPVYLLDEFCSLHAGRGDVSLKLASQTGGSLLELLRNISPDPALDPLHHCLKFLPLDGQAIDEFLGAFFKGDLTQVNNNESRVVLIEPDSVARGHLTDEPFRVERRH